MITINDKTYIESQNIKVFPCAYRGYYNDSTTPVTTLVFDPEARATTESNFTNTFHKLSNNKDSYVITWIPNSSSAKPTNKGTLKCVIDGYYFEIYNQSMSDFFYTDQGIQKPYYLCIKTESIPLSTAEPDATDIRKTNVLSSFADTTSYLDIKHNNTYAFTGLLISKDSNGGGSATASLAPFMISDYTEVSTYASGVNTTGLYYLNTDKEFVLVGNTPLEEGTLLYEEAPSYKLDPSKLPITNLLDVGSGNYSIQMIEDITATGTNTTVASGDYSVSLGLSTEASNKASTALGNNTTASGKGALSAGNHTESSGEGAMAAGNSTKASGKGSVAAGTNTEAVGNNTIALGEATKATGTNAIALGTNTEASGSNAVALGEAIKAGASNQVVLGKYNIEDNNQAFIIANGTSDSNRLNKFTVSYEGDVKAQGTLEVKGNITATGATNNLILGTTAAESSGSITVYGTEANETPIFKVTNTGATTIAETTSITKDEQSNNIRSGALKVAGGVGIGRNLNVGENLNIGGAASISKATTLKDTLTVDKATALNNKLTVAGTTTLNDNLSVATDKTTSLGGTLIVDKATTLKDTLTVDKATILKDTLTVKGNKATSLEGTLAIAGITTVSNDTQSTNPTTGALKVTGGVGIGKNLCVGGAAAISGNATISSAATISGTATIKGTTTITNETDYTSANAAACIIKGGVYIGKKLHVNGDTTFRNNLEITEKRVAIKEATASTTANNGALVVNGGVGIGKDLNIAGNNNIAGNLTIAGTSGSSNILQLGNESTANKGGELKIYGTGTTTIFEVDKTGNVTAEGDLSVAGQISTGGKLIIDKTIEISATGISGLPSLTVNGTINATTFNAISDARLKTNVEKYVFKKSILDLPIKQFEYIKDDTHTKYIGCLAQDLQEICPELVTKNSEGFLSIQESKIIYALLQEVKELKERIELLERK